MRDLSTGLLLEFQSLTSSHGLARPHFFYLVRSALAIAFSASGFIN